MVDADLEDSADWIGIEYSAAISLSSPMALTGENLSLWTNPLAFLMKTSVSPADNYATSFQQGGDIMANLAKQNQIQQKVATLTPADPVHGGDHQVVRDKARVCYGTLVASASYPQAFDLKIYIKKHGKLGMDLSAMVPMWYLPWMSGKLVRMTIPAKQNLNDRDANWDDRDPDLFFTAAINGCSVFVSGTQQNPTVYHGGVTGGMLNLNDPIGHWRTLFNQLQLNPRNNWNSTVDFGEVTKLQYITKGTVATPKPGLYKTAVAGANMRVGSGKASTSNITDTTEDYVDYFNDRMKNKNFKLADYQPWGAVFGVRDVNGNWKFFLQENCVMTTLRRSSVFSKWIARRDTLALALRQFYPGNGGHSVPVQRFTFLTP